MNKIKLKYIDYNFNKYRNNYNHLTNLKFNMLELYLIPI